MQLSPFRFWLLNGGILLSLLASQPTAAQIVPDNTLPDKTVVIPNGIKYEIIGGTTVGNNLFHSFEQFSIPKDGSAYFNNSPTIENIISRVTKFPSNIDGLIRANGANLFLINPNGIIFGSNASLNIGGSFLATTADSMKFTNGREFSAVNPQAPPLLKVNVPMGLQFGQTPGEISNAGRLRVDPGKTLALVGGNINLPGGRLTAAGGRIELGSVAGNSLVSLSLSNQSWVLGYEGINNFQDISLSQRSDVSTTGDRGGDIQIQGRRVILTDGSQVRSVSNTEKQAGNLRVRASELVKVAGVNRQRPSAIANQVNKKATGEGATLTIETGQLIVQDGGTISTNTFGSGRGVNLIVRASESVTLEGTSPDGAFPSSLSAQVERGASGKGGTLTIETQRLTVEKGAQVSTATFGQNQAGDLSVTATESVTLAGTAPDKITPSGLFAQVEEGAIGDGGNLIINTRRLTILDGAQVSTAARTGGKGGTLSINATDAIQLSGASPAATRNVGRSGIFVSAERGATRNAGALNITTGQLTVEDRAEISANNFGPGNPGTATLNVRKLNIRNGGEVRARAFASGSGGQLIVNADSVEISGTGTIGSETFPSALSTQATGSGPAGDIQVRSRTVKLNNQGRITAETASSDGGNITLNLQELLTLRNMSRISTSAGTDQAGGGGDGGNIKINAPFIVSAPNNNSDITANAFNGRGGRVEIDATGIFYLVPRSREELVQLLVKPPLDPSRLPTNDITAISQQNPSLSGTVIINTPDVDPSRGLLQLPTEPENVQVAQGCQTGENQSSIAFFNTGRGGLAPSPYEPLSQSNIWEDVSPPSQKTASATPPDTIVEAQGWIINDKGEVVLVAEAPTPGFQSRCRLR